MMSLLRLLRYVWALPNTLLGLLFVPVALASGGAVRRVDGVVEVYGAAVSWLLRHAVPLRGGAAALTLGHVVLGRDSTTLIRCRTHELVHVRQYEVWGPAFIPAYVIASLIAFIRGGDFYRDNLFEQEAFRNDAGR